MEMMTKELNSIAKKRNVYNDDNQDIILNLCCEKVMEKIFLNIHNSGVRFLFL